MTDNQWLVINKNGRLISTDLDKQSLIGRMLFDNTSILRNQFDRVLLEARECGHSSCVIKADDLDYQAEFRRLGNESFLSIDVGPRTPSTDEILQRDLLSSREWLLEKDGRISEHLSCSISVSYQGSVPSFAMVAEPTEAE